MQRNLKRKCGSVRFDNSDRVLLVTGGGQGIGRAVARAWADSGGTSAVMEKNAALAGGVEPWGKFFAGDVADPESCKRTVREVIERFGGIDLLVPNAVIEGPESYRLPHEMTPDLWERYVSVNFTGMQNIGREVLPGMVEQGGGYVVIVSSVQALGGAAQSSLYAATKAAGHNLIGTWGCAYARHGIRVNGVMPGAIFTEGMVPKLEGQGGPKQLGNRHPRGCLGLPEEVAAVVLALASPIAENVFGAAWSVDGGLLAHAAFDNPFDPESCPEQPVPSWQKERRS